ncbi:MAG: glycoside hydrolase [Gammaproteobacteria bacterium]|nr:glycoside hydrolase [Gammaproteobacteria bacterium]
MSTMIALGGAMAGLAVRAAPPPAAAAAPDRDGLYRDLGWRMIGPMRGGRTRALAGVPAQPHVFYMGAVNGGVWKTDDAGRTWRPIFDAQPTQSIGAIAVAPSAPDTVYVGSGEGLLRPDLSVGNGMYRSTDGGLTWSHLGLDDAQQIAQLAVDPRDARRVFAAVLGHPYGPSEERGIYRTVDGGASWQRVLYKDADTGGSTVVIDPSHPETVYAGLWQSRLGPWEDKNEFNGTAGGLFKSTDGGTTWRQLANGLPANLSQINLAIAPSRPQRLYAEIATTEPGDYSSAAGLGLFRSDDSGEGWTRITTDPRPALRIGGGDLAMLAVDASNPDVLYVASIVTMKSSDGGKTWMPLRGAPGGDDYQSVWVSPNDPRIIALGSDQGAVISLNGGQSWSSWLNQPTAQLYHIAVAPTFPYRVCAGQQESGSLCISSRGNDGSITNRDWHPVGVIEYGYVAPDPLDPDVIYGAGRNEVSKYHLSTGQVQNVTPIPVRTAQVRVDRTEPLAFSPLDPHTLYYGADRLYRTTDGGANWQAISPDLAREAGALPASVGSLHPKDAEQQRGVIYALAPSMLDAGILWVGTDDGFVWLTRDGGARWTNVTPPALTPWSKVTQIDASHFDAGTAYVSVSRMRIDDLRPYIYRTRDYGASWQPIAAGLAAEGPVNAVREDPQRRGLLFAATETAVRVSFDDGGHWESLQLNLPATSMRDLWVHGDDLIVATHGRSIWILDDISRLRQLGGAAPPNVVLLSPARAWRVQRSTWTDTPIPADEPLASNPPAGAIIEFFLSRDARRPVSLEILDGRGETVRRFSSDDPPTPGPDELARELIPPDWLERPRVLPATRGMHRWVWDLRHAPPISVTHGYPISAVPHATPRSPQGPVALPGSYRVRLTVDGRRYETNLTVQEDPRVKVAPQALEAQLQLSRQLAELLSQSSQTLLAARSQREQLKALAPGGASTEPLAHYRAQLELLLGSEQPQPDKAGAKPEGERQQKPPAEQLPDVQEHIASLYAEVLRPDAAPTAAQESAAQSLQRSYQALLSQWRQLQAQLPDLNQRLRAARLAPLRTDLPPSRDPNVAEEE